MSTTPPVVITSTTKTPDGLWLVETVTTTKVSSANQPPSGIVIPSNAKSSGILDNSPNWKGEKDAGTPGSVSSAFTKYIDSTSGRQFNAVQTNHAGYRWHNQFGTALLPTNFVYCLTVKSDNWKAIAQLELNMNHVLENSPGASKGPNVFLCLQASMGSKTWEYTLVSNNSTHWHASNIPVDFSTWIPNTWKVLRLKTSHDAKGIVTYESIEIDGVNHLFDPSCKGPSIENLNWDAGHMLINYQMNGSTSAQSTMNSYAKQIEVWYW